LLIAQAVPVTILVVLRGIIPGRPGIEKDPGFTIDLSASIASP